MSLIQNISSTLKTWVFKKKVLKFSGRFRRDPMACFYCPELCRFSCPTAENLKTNAVTPRGKMSLLHLAERGHADEEVAGSTERRQWYLEQCTGCGRCTEFCLYEVDVASNLRGERARHWQSRLASDEREAAALGESLRSLSGKVLLCEAGRKTWWEKRPGLMARLGVEAVAEVALPARAWGAGKVQTEELRRIGEGLKRCTMLCVESPETAWFLAKGVGEEAKALGKTQIRTAWQGLFGQMVELGLSPEIVFHESFHLSRLLPRLGYSIPMYERGSMPFHSGWNMLDCGGEGYYQDAHPGHATEMGKRFLFDVKKDGRKVDEVVCQNLSCVGHLRASTGVKATYWLDFLGDKALGRN